MKSRFLPFPGIIIVLLIMMAVPPSYLKGQTEQVQDLKQYLFPSFTKSTIVTKTGKSLNLLLNYNTVSERMVFEQKGQYYDIANPEASDTATIEGRKFIPFEACFLEVAVTGKTALFIRHKRELVAQGRPMGYGTTSQTTSSNVLSAIQAPSGYYNFKLPEGYDIKPATLYYVNTGDKIQNFMGEKQFLKILKGKEDAIKKYARENRLKFDRADDLVKIVRYCNTIKD